MSPDDFTPQDHAIAELEQQNEQLAADAKALRELLRDCPVLRDQPKWVSLTSEWTKWIERAKEEALKL